MHNSGSVIETINCPKCGYAQEKRLDCIKCGVVFNKYFALFSDGKSANTNRAEASNSRDVSGNDIYVKLSELEMQVKSLTGRFAEVEFEKIERNKLKADMKNLEQLLSENLESMGRRLESMPVPEVPQAKLSELEMQVKSLTGRFAEVEIEKTERNKLKADMKNLEQQLSENLESMSRRLENPPVPEVPQETHDPRLPEISERLAQAEAKLGDIDSASQYMVEFNEKNEFNLREISDLKQQITTVREDLEKIRGQLEAIIQAQNEIEPRTPLEEDVHIIRKNLDELRAFLHKPAES
ncbi:MAG: hypothetical protein JXA73_09025 [Acidobacteria bacterium]|nr:hypothetical protein [Acidobacteriota bacterium]